VGRLDILLNNGAWTRRVPHQNLEDLNDEIWDKTATDLRALLCMRAAAPRRKKSPGAAIINVSSTAPSMATAVRLPTRGQSGPDRHDEIIGQTPGPGCQGQRACARDRGDRFCGLAPGVLRGHWRAAPAEAPCHGRIRGRSPFPG